jgi:mercuric ion transport protein
METEHRPSQEIGDKITVMAAAGGLLGALAAMSCCILPFVFVSAGISGAWLIYLTALAPYQTYVVAATAAAIALGLVMTYRRALACEPGSWCARPRPRQFLKFSLWSAAVLTVVALALPSVLLRLTDI